ANDFVIPYPRFGIYRLADGAKQSQRTQIVFHWPFRSPFHECTNCSWRGVKNCYAIFLNNAPESIRLRKVWCAFIHEARRSVCQRTIDDIAVTCDPAHIRRAPENIFVTEIEHVFRSQFRIKQITASRMQNSLWFPGRTAGVQNE